MTANAVDEGVAQHVAAAVPSILPPGSIILLVRSGPLGKNPDGAYKMAQLVRSNQALYDVCLAYNLPLISGKDSMKNDFYDGTVKISIPPTLLFSVIGRIEDIRRAVTNGCQAPRDIVYLLGKTGDELGGSEYFALSGAIGNKVPVVDPARAYRRYQHTTWL